MSLLTSHGHADAAAYPLGYLMVEAEIVEKRLTDALKTQMVLTQSAIASTRSKKAASNFTQAIKDL